MRRLIIMAAIALACSPLQASDGMAWPEWMVGSWQRIEGKSWAEEVWIAPRGDMMFGIARSGTGYDQTFWEQMRIERGDANALTLWVVSADQKPVAFEATVSMENRMIFENAKHDYPQRIEYWRERGMLKAEISQMDGSRKKAFAYKKARK
jgi:hypothetical protein